MNIWLSSYIKGNGMIKLWSDRGKAVIPPLLPSVPLPVGTLRQWQRFHPVSVLWILEVGFTGRRIHGYFAAAYPVVFHHPYVGILVFAVTEYGAQRYIHQFFFYKGSDVRSEADVAGKSGFHIVYGTVEGGVVDGDGNRNTRAVGRYVKILFILALNILPLYVSNSTLNVASLARSRYR